MKIDEKDRTFLLVLLQKEKQVKAEIDSFWRYLKFSYEPGDDKQLNVDTGEFVDKEEPDGE
jgi:hypothetical protein